MHRIPMNQRNVRLHHAPAATLALWLGLFIPFAQGAGEPTLVLNDANSAPFTNEAGTGLVDIVAGEAFRRAG